MDKFQLIMLFVYLIIIFLAWYLAAVNGVLTI